MEALFSEITIGANPLTLWLALTLVITTYFFIANAAESTSKGSIFALLQSGSLSTHEAQCVSGEECGQVPPCCSFSRFLGKPAPSKSRRRGSVSAPSAPGTTRSLALRRLDFPA